MTETVSAAWSAVSAAGRSAGSSTSGSVASRAQADQPATTSRQASRGCNSDRWGRPIAHSSRPARTLAPAPEAVQEPAPEPTREPAPDPTAEAAEAVASRGAELAAEGFRELGGDAASTLHKAYIEDNPHPLGQKLKLPAKK